MPDYKQICRRAALEGWPRIRELADDYMVSERTVRAAIERRQVEAIKTDVLRVNPDSWRSYIASKHVIPDNAR